MIFPECIIDTKSLDRCNHLVKVKEEVGHRRKRQCTISLLHTLHTHSREQILDFDMITDKKENAIFLVFSI